MSGSLFSSIPSNLVLPGLFFTASSANVTQPLNNVVVLLGDITTEADVVPTLVTSVLAAQTLYGKTSTLAGMVATYTALDRLSTVYALPVTVTVVDEVSTPQVTTSLTALGQMPVGYIVSAYGDAASLTAIDTWLNETTGRWNYTSQLLGQAICANTYATSGVSALVAAATNNSKYITQLNVPDSTSTTIPNIAAAYAGTIVPVLEANPGIPLNGLVIPIDAPAIGDFPDFSVRNTLETAGLSTIQTNPAGQVVLTDAVNLHVTDTLGDPDTGWAKFTAVNELSYVIEAFLALYPVYFQGKKIVTDDSLATAGTIFITTNTARAIFIHCYQGLADQGMVTNVSAFTDTSLGVQVQNVGGGRFNAYLPITLVSGLEIVAVNIQFVSS